MAVGAATAYPMTNQTILDTEAIHNFRDYGGYSAAGGARVKTGLLWRSGQHSEATDADLSAVSSLDLQNIIDLRGNSERGRAPCKRTADFSGRVLFFDGETAGLSLAPHEEAASKAIDAAGAREAMQLLYSRLPFRGNLIAALRLYFAALATGEGASLVHCMAGKDRTGMAVDLLHHALGVHRDDAMADFLLTNTVGDVDARIAAGARTIRGKHGAQVDDETVRVLMGVEESYLLAMRKAVEDEHGSVDAFLRDVLGVDDAAQKALRLHLLTQ